VTRVSVVDNARERFAGNSAKLSNGLEPLTPSLPSSGRVGIRVHRCPPKDKKVLLDVPIAVDCSTRLCSPLDSPVYALSTRRLATAAGIEPDRRVMH
jgi:hypothetical protein